MVSTIDFDSIDLGSIPSIAFLLLWLNWIKRKTSNLEIAGSSPARSSIPLWCSWLSLQPFTLSSRVQIPAEELLGIHPKYIYIKL